MGCNLREAPRADKFTESGRSMRVLGAVGVESQCLMKTELQCGKTEEFWRCRLLTAARGECTQRCGAVRLKWRKWQILCHLYFTTIKATTAMVVSVGVERLWAWVWEEAPEEFWTVPSDLALGSSITALSPN